MFAEFGPYMLGAMFALPFILAGIYMLVIGLHPVGFLRPHAKFHVLDIEQFFTNPIHIAAAQMIEQVMTDYMNRAVTRPERYGEEAARDFRRHFHMTEVYRDRGFQFHWRLGSVDPSAMRILASRENEGAIVEYVGPSQAWVEREGVKYMTAAEVLEPGITTGTIVIRLQFVQSANGQKRLLAWEDTMIGLRLHEHTLDTYEHR